MWWGKVKAAVVLTNACLVEHPFDAFSTQSSCLTQNAVTRRVKSNSQTPGREQR